MTGSSFVVSTGDAADPWYDVLAEREEWHRTLNDVEAPGRQTSDVELASPYAAHGNEAALAWLYMRLVCLRAARTTDQGA